MAAKTKVMILLLFATFPQGPVFVDSSGDSTVVTTANSHALLSPADLAEVDRIVYWPGGASAAYWVTAVDSVSEIVGLIKLVEEAPCFCFPDQWLTLRAGVKRFNFRFNDHRLDYLGADSTGTRVTYAMPGKLWTKLYEIRGAR